jgi:toxin YoeB
LHILLRDIELNPFSGKFGLTEILKHFTNRASKRINQEHRLVYWLEGKGTNKKITIYSCKGHY